LQCSASHQHSFWRLVTKPTNRYIALNTSHSPSKTPKISQKTVFLKKFSFPALAQAHTRTHTRETLAKAKQAFRREAKKKTAFSMFSCLSAEKSFLIKLDFFEKRANLTL